MNREELLKVAKPILFNTEMVRAILDGRKTETRRCVRRLELEFDVDGSIIGVNDRFEGRTFPMMNYAPYKPGDALYVRETWNYGYFDCSEFSNECWFQELPRGTKTSFIVGRYVYRAEFSNDELHELECKNDDGYRGISWHPSIHMPKEVARIFLKVTDVRVERLQDIDFFGCINEGLAYEQFEINLIAKYASLWNSTIPKKRIDEYGWDANPWVWVIEFGRIEPDALDN